MSVDVADAAVARFRELLADRLGWTFVDSDTPQLAQVLRRRAAGHGLNDIGYLRRIGAGTTPEELAGLAQDLAITETYFFRHGEQFRALAEEALPARIRDRAPDRELRMLSVGCSSGEEAYTLAIVGLQARPDPRWRVHVLGLDANPSVLRRAEAGRYSTWSLRQTPPQLRSRWFRERDGVFEPVAELRDAVSFRHHNVADDDAAIWQEQQYDVILCRNLLMYLTPTAAQTLIHRITRALAPGGYLFLGHTDTLGSRPVGLQALHSNDAFYYCRPPTGAHPAEPVGTHRPALRSRSDRTVDPAATRPDPSTPGPARPGGPLREQALSLLREERFTEALAVVEAALPSEPTPAELLLHGVLLAQAGRVDDAEIVARRVLDVNGLHADAHHLLGVCLEDSAAAAVAVGHYRLAAHLDPHFAMPRLRLGLLARRRGDLAAAGVELERARTLLRTEDQERITLFGGGFGRISLAALCRAEIEAVGAAR
ncbi:MAG TPA: CheR family methyltransferase [Actinoplanes sp.]|nr:CheR family methyltransferase [Actinoplanes sp.]